jgi:histidine triad (HIT) family protein
VSCVFCRIVEGKAPAYVVYRDDGVTVFLDIYPVEKGHLLIIPNEHFESIMDAPPAIAVKVLATAAAYARIYRREVGAPGVNVIVNSGRPAGQEVFHFHVHVIPRWRGGGWRTLTIRHRLTESEAYEVVRMLEPHLHIVKEYLNHAK